MSEISKEPIQCMICGEKVHTIREHLKKHHPETTFEEYVADYPDAPTLSAFAQAKINEVLAEQSSKQKNQTISANLEKVFLYEAFGFSKDQAKAFENSRGEHVKINVLKERGKLVPEVREYVFESDTLRDAIMAIELNEPLYIWGQTGTGKTEMIEQICARTNRELMRVQHTIGTEERDIVGQTLANKEGTYFSLGPLPMAMKNGWVYLADEYDFGLPAVLSVYQAVLEGKPLVIKDADEENRIIHPHPNFRFVATGNTNGTGDETFLYNGTSVQHAANYDRFGVVIQKHYMDAKQEEEMIVKKTKIMFDDAQRIVKFAQMVRDGFATQKITSPISPRTLLRIAKFGKAKGNDFKHAIKLSFSNKLPSVDKAVVDGMAARIFGA